MYYSVSHLGVTQIFPLFFADTSFAFHCNIKSCNVSPWIEIMRLGYIAQLYGLVIVPFCFVSFHTPHSVLLENSHLLTHDKQVQQHLIHLVFSLPLFLWVWQFMWELPRKVSLTSLTSITSEILFGALNAEQLHNFSCKKLIGILGTCMNI